MKAVLFVLFLCLTGCFVTPLVDSFQKSGLNEGARKDLLPKKVKDFYNEIVGGRFLNFGDYLVEEQQDELLRKLRAGRRTEKIVSGKLDFVDFNSNAKVAMVDVIVEYYLIPQYVVNERIERQLWVFTDPYNGWQLKELELLE